MHTSRSHRLITCLLLTCALSLASLALAAEPAASPATAGAKPFRGFCACSCSFVRDCNTSADCGGAACLPGITCC